MRWGIAMDPLAIGWVSLSLSPSPHTHTRKGGREKKKVTTNIMRMQEKRHCIKLSRP